MEHHIDVLQGRHDPGRVVQVERTDLQRPPPRFPTRSHRNGLAHGLELSRIAAGEHGPHAGLDRLGRDQPAGVAGRAVNHQPSFAHEPKETPLSRPGASRPGLLGCFSGATSVILIDHALSAQKARWPRGPSHQVILF